MAGKKTSHSKSGRNVKNRNVRSASVLEKKSPSLPPPIAAASAKLDKLTEKTFSASDLVTKGVEDIFTPISRNVVSSTPSSRKRGVLDAAAAIAEEENNSSTPLSSTVIETSSLRSSISDLYALGLALKSNGVGSTRGGPVSFRYLAPTITTTSLSKQQIDNNRKRQKVVPDTISAEQIWGQLSLLGAPMLHDIGVNVRKLKGIFSDDKTKKTEATNKKGSDSKKKIDFEEESDDIDELAESDEEDVQTDSSDDELLEDDPELARLMASRKGKKANKTSEKSSREARRQQALLAFATGDDGENDEDEWAEEFETRRGGDADDEDDDVEGKRDAPRKLSKREEKLKKKFGKASESNKNDLGDDDDLYGDMNDGGDEEDEDDNDVMAELYGDDYEGAGDKFLGEDEEDDDVHGTSDEEGEEEGELYDAADDERFQKGMFPTDRDDGFDDDILKDKSGTFGGEGESGENAYHDDVDDDDDDEGLTDFQIRQKREQRLISSLEQKRAFNADWSMGGEVEGRARPKDSLVDEDLDFEHGMKSVPVITEGFTAKLEERIKKRILDNNFNDVVRRAPTTTAGDLNIEGVAKRDTTTDAEKSKYSLMDLYEQDYLAKLKKMEDAAGMNENLAEPLTEIEKDELKAIQMWKRLAQHLDALSNYYFTPKPVQEDLSVRVRAVDKAAPAISMESVGAFAISKASAIAPQDTFRPAQKSMLGNVSLEEMSPRERQALRRSKKEASASTKARVEKKVAENKRRKEAASSKQ